MQSRDFCFWLQGFFELNKPFTVNEEQTTLIKKHLALVFKHEIDPSMGSAQHQSVLNALHKPQPMTGITPDKDVLIRC